MVGLSLTALSGYAQTAQAEGAPQGTRASGARGIRTSSADETSRIVLACINQPAFKKYYAANGDGAINLVGLPSGTQIPAKSTALGHGLSVRSVDEATAGSLSNYFFFGNLKKENEHVSVSVTYFYNHSAEGYKVVMVDMELVQNGDQYEIVNSNFKGDLL